MTDVLVVTAVVPGAYPSINTMWATSARRGMKTEAYGQLFAAVKYAAQVEMARTGWTMADYYCRVDLTLYQNTRREVDCSNTAKCENDALVAARVAESDSWFRPFSADSEFDPDGDSRVVIVIRRRFPDLHAKPIEKTARRESRPAFAKPRKIVGAQLAEPMGEVNGVPVPRSQMLDDLRKRGYR